MLKFFLIAIVAVAIPLFIIHSYMGNEYWDFVSIVALLIMLVPYFFISYLLYPRLVSSLKDIFKFGILFYVVYYIFGLLPISTYRDYLDTPYWVIVIIVSVFFYLAGGVLAKHFFKGEVAPPHAPKKYSITAYNIPRIIIILSVCCMVYVVAKHGLVFLNPEARFGISAKLAYLIEFSMPAVLVLHCFNIDKKKLVALYFLVFILLLSLGYRNQPVLLAVGMMLIAVSNIELSELMRFRKKFSFAVISIILFMGSSYIVRINNSVGRTLNWTDTIGEFDIAWPVLTLPFIPLHMAAREGLGVAQIALERLDNVVSYVERAHFFFLDFLTMLPGYSLTSGRVLGHVVNLNETSSLTPSIVGGLSIGYGATGVFLFLFIMGFFLKLFSLKYRYTKSPKFLALSVIVCVYFIELINRGIFKPMYIFAIFIVLVSCLSFNFKRRLG